MENPIHQAKPLSHEVHAGAGCDGPGDPLDGCSGLMDRLDPPTADRESGAHVLYMEDFKRCGSD